MADVTFLGVNILKLVNTTPIFRFVTLFSCLLEHLVKLNGLIHPKRVNLQDIWSEVKSWFLFSAVDQGQSSRNIYSIHV